VQVDCHSFNMLEDCAASIRRPEAQQQQQHAVGCALAGGSSYTHSSSLNSLGSCVRAGETGSAAATISHVFDGAAFDKHTQRTNRLVPRLAIQRAGQATAIAASVAGAAVAEPLEARLPAGVVVEETSSGQVQKSGDPSPPPMNKLEHISPGACGKHEPIAGAAGTSLAASTSTPVSPSNSNSNTNSSPRQSGDPAAAATAARSALGSTETPLQQPDVDMSSSQQGKVPAAHLAELCCVRTCYGTLLCVVLCCAVLCCAVRCVHPAPLRQSFQHG
jgi:hypothetical protein